MKLLYYIQARLAQSVERETFNLKAKGSSPLSGGIFFNLKFDLIEISLLHQIKR